MWPLTVSWHLCLDPHPKPERVGQPAVGHFCSRFRSFLWFRSSASFLLQDRKQPDVCDRFFHDVPFQAEFASDVPALQSMTTMPGVDGFTMKVDALYKVRGVGSPAAVSLNGRFCKGEQMNR